MRCPPSWTAIALIASALFSFFFPPFPAKACAGAGADSVEARSPEAADSVEARGPEAAEPDSSERQDEWLPIPEEDVEIPEALLEDRPAGGAGTLIRGGMTQGRFGLRRVALTEARAGIRTDVGFLVEGTGPRKVRPGIRMNGRALLLAGGRVSISRAPPLYAEALGIARHGRPVQAPRSGVIAAAPSLGASAGAMDGVAIALQGGASVWSFAGIRPESRERLAGAGLGIARHTMHVAAAAGATDRGFRLVSLTMRSRGRGRSVGAEGIASGEGRAVLAEVAARGDGTLVTARWRYRSWTPRRVASELSAQTLGKGAKARLTWRSWAGDAAGDDGILELEASLPRAGSERGPFRVRLGAAGLGSDKDPAQRREAYGMLDATVAQDAGRSLSVHLVRRGSSGSGSRAASTTMGTRLDVRAGRMGEHAILIESTGSTAWGVELTPSGATTLRARSKPGMWVTARGGFGARPWRLGYALERGEDAEGPRPWSGTIWLRLWR